MGKRVGMEVAIAAAEAVALCNIDVAAVYPITPQSHIAEHMRPCAIGAGLHFAFPFCVGGCHKTFPETMFSKSPNPGSPVLASRPPGPSAPGVANWRITRRNAQRLC